MFRIRPHWPLTLSLAFFPFACSGDEDVNEDGDTPANQGTGEDDIIIDAQAGANGDGDSPSGPRDGGIIELTRDEATDLSTAGCTGWTAEGESIPAVLEFVVDVSGSMGRPPPEGGNRSKWEITHEALVEAITDLPASVAVGMLMYPNMPWRTATPQQKEITECVEVEEMIPVVPLGDLDSEQRATITDGLDRAQPDFLTPTHDAYKYALENGLKPYKSSARKFMLLITDGAPTLSQGCFGDDEDVQDMPTAPIIADIAAANAEGISTFLIGAPGSEMSTNSGTDMRPWLSEAAQLGGTPLDGCSIEGPVFCHLDMTEEPDFAAALKSGLAQIAGQIIDSCTFVIPEPPPGETINPEKTNVVVARGDGTVLLVLPDEIGECSQGWQFNDEGNVVLCEQSCNDVKLDPKATVQMTFGCGLDEVVPIR